MPRADTLRRGALFPEMFNPMNPNQFEFTLTDADMAESFAAARRRLRARSRDWKKLVPSIILLAALVAAVLWPVARGTSKPPVGAGAAPAPSSSLSDIWQALIPWVIIFAFAIFFIRNARGKPKPHRLADIPNTLIVETGKITLVQPFTHTESQWEAFYGYDVTKNLFLLYSSDPKGSEALIFNVIPKRAFASLDQAAEFQKLLEINVYPRVSRFPVIQPVPVLPVSEPDERAG